MTVCFQKNNDYMLLRLKVISFQNDTNCKNKAFSVSMLILIICKGSAIMFTAF